MLQGKFDLPAEIYKDPIGSHRIRYFPTASDCRKLLDPTVGSEIRQLPVGNRRIA